MGVAPGLPLQEQIRSRVWQVIMRWTPNKVTFLRVLGGFAAVCLFGRGAWAKLTAGGLTVATMGLEARDGRIGRKKKTATPMRAQRDRRGGGGSENVFVTYDEGVGMAS